MTEPIDIELQLTKAPKPNMIEDRQDEKSADDASSPCRNWSCTSRCVTRDFNVDDQWTWK